MKVVVTGASGFIGCALVDRLAGSRIDTVAVSRRPLPPRPGVFRVQVETYAATPVGDVLVHLAESPFADSMSTPDDGVLDRLAGHGYARLVYLSTAAIYGDSSELPHRPDEPVNPASNYARFKLAHEAIILRSGGAVIRSTNVFGPRMNGGTVIADILAQIPGTGALRLRNDAAIRDFMWIDDVTRLLELGVHSRADGLFNAASGEAVSIRELARRALVLAGEGERPVTANTSTRSVLRLDFEDTVRTFGWRPEVTLDQGLSRLIGVRA
jgi:nucleoside-diphosphate-sugar epimerase